MRLIAGHDDRPPLVFDKVEADKSSGNPALAHGSYGSFCLHLPFAAVKSLPVNIKVPLYYLPSEQLIHVE